MMSAHRVREVDGCTVIDVAASYSRQTFLDLLALAKTIVSKDKPQVILNLAELPHINSEAIGLLVLVHDECTKTGGKMVLASIPARVERVLKLAGVFTFFTRFPDEQAAVEHFRKQSGATGEEAAKDTPHSQAEESVDLEAAARDLVTTTIRSRRHHEVIELFNKRLTKIASLDEIASGIGVPRLTIEHVVSDLVRAGVLMKDGELYAWQPSPDAERQMGLFRRALSNPRLRTRVMAWVYAEEKR